MADEQEIRGVVEDWARAVSAGDRRAILARHSPDLLMFDFTDTKTGLAAYDAQWDFFYRAPTGPIRFELGDVAVTAGEGVAFVTGLVHCEGTSAGPLDFRLTAGLRKIHGDWTITHEHHSVPTVEGRFADPEA